MIFELKKALLVFLIIFIPFTAAFSQSSTDKALIELLEKSYQSDEPTWLLMERGKQAFEIGEFGLASRIFREVITRENNYPDAEIWLGYIFEQEGEYGLAEKQYLAALDRKSSLYIPDDEFTILYKLSDIYKKTNQYGKYESTLLEILNNDQSEAGNIEIQYAVLDVLKDKGIDKMFELYRFENDKYNRARTGIGIFYYQTGRYTEAQLNLLIPVISLAAAGFDFIYNKTAIYEYTDFESHISEMLRYPELADFLQKNDFFSSLYYLAASLYAGGNKNDAEKIWRIVSKFDAEGSTWKIRASRQLRSPFIEPIITHRS